MSSAGAYGLFIGILHRRIISRWFLAKIGNYKILRLELIKSKCLPILLYSTEVCPTNAADRHTSQFAISKIVHKIFGAMSKDPYSVICKYFGIHPVEQLITRQQNRLINRYCEQQILSQGLH